MEATGIQSLPVEILEMILDHLEEDPPSYYAFCVQPTLNLITSKHKHPPLKSLSRVSKTFRQLTISRLFRHAMHLVTIDARRQAQDDPRRSFPEWPCEFWDFVALLERLGLGHVVRTFTLAIKEDPELDEERSSCNLPLTDVSLETTEYKSRWVCLFSHATPLLSGVTIIAPPVLFGLLCGIPNGNTTEIAHMPYQTLSLWVNPFPKSDQSLRVEQLEGDLQPLLTARPWTHLLLNEGSFERGTDSDFLDRISSHFFMSSVLYNIQRSDNVFDNLRFVSYTGISAPPEHLRMVQYFLAVLPKLTDFAFSLRSTVPLLPDPHPLSVSRRRLNERLEEGYEMLLTLPSQAEDLAQELNLKRCLSDLKHVECLDEPPT